ncbi:cobalt-zinc-cadmium resistance protein [Photobacterium proteolyticum]|uniref:Cobalt-zinc-cadmium resistance protein n=1 Tax=Photobacterium proteolyticum TaxID=1903952 RepID=A0A1Q9GSG7_9GAMM|nr:cation transporter [Photobacterium proteolyticum]OLQ77646.1 cobalt-zinc-cadmium resistance protein [Photobacterium proteolyticum]
MTCNVQLERRLLQFSTFSSFLFAVMGIGLGLWMGSLVIVFDGAYSFISLALTLVSLVAAVYIRQPDGASWDKAKVESLVIAFKGVVITVMCCISFSTAVVAIFNGGREVDTGLALLFGVINIVGCLATIWVMARKGKQANSALVEAEVKQWAMDTVISGAVMIGFVIATFMEYTDYSQYAVYADPVMVVLASIYFVIVPLKMVYGAVKDLRRLSAQKRIACEQKAVGALMK